METFWIVSKAGMGAAEPMWLREADAAVMKRQGLKPVAEATGVSAFDASDVKKALTSPAMEARNETLTQMGKNSAAIGMLVGEMINSFKRGGAASGTKAYTGKAAKLALSLGVKPVTVNGESYVFRVSDLDAVAKKLSPSDEALLKLAAWYQQGQ